VSRSRGDSESSAIASLEPSHSAASVLELIFASLVTAAAAALLFYYVRGRLSLPKSLLLAGLFAFGTSAYSTASRGLWQHGPSMLLRDDWRAEPHPVEWLLIEWPKGAAEPTKYWLSTLPAEISLTELVRMDKHRWIIERDYQELKQELGLGHSEGRGWRGFHHHATLCLAAYGVPGGRTEPFFPLGASRLSPITRDETPARLPAAGRAFVLNDITLHRSRACGFLLRAS
jgi:hypothetical protein